MGCSSFLKSPKKEQEDVPDNSLKRVDILDDLEGFLGIRDEISLPLDQLHWNLMDLDEFSVTEAKREEEEEGELLFCHVPKACFFEEEDEYFSTKFVKTENAAVFYDNGVVEKTVSLNLNLNYQEVLNAWSGRGSLWVDDPSLSKATHGCYMGEVPVMAEERTRREALVLRYKEKRQSRLFSKKIRYQVRKLNADKRPRMKGRFVKGKDT